MSNPRTTTEQARDDITPMFHDVLGDAWWTLPEIVRAAHQVHDQKLFCGRAKVERGTGTLGRVIAGLFRFPPASDSIDVTVQMNRTTSGETWVRQFGDQRFRSHLSVADTQGQLIERFGPFSFRLDVPATPDGLSLPVLEGWFLGFPLPRWTLPESKAREYVSDGKFHFDVELRAPLTRGLIVRYRGWLVSATDTPKVEDKVI